MRRPAALLKSRLTWMLLALPGLVSAQPFQPPTPVSSYEDFLPRWSGVYASGNQSILIDMQLGLVFKEAYKWSVYTVEEIKKDKQEIDTLKQKVSALEQKLSALQQPGTGPRPAGGDDARFKALEDRIAKLEAAGTTLKAPLTVTGAGGKTILKLSADGYLLLGSDGGSQVALIAQPGAPAKVGVQSGAYAVQLSAGNGKALVDVLNTETQTVSLVAANDQVGLTVEKDGKTAAGLGSVPGKAVALRLYDKAGRTVAAAGENPSTSGTGIIYVGNGSKNSAALAANSDGSGVVHAFANDGTVGAGLIGAERLVGAYNKAGNAVVTIGKSENSEGGNVTSRDPNGEGVFRAGYRSDIGGGEACVNRVKKGRTICLGINVGAIQ